MLDPIIKSCLEFLSMVFAYEIGSTEFYITLGAGLFAFILVARLLAGLFESTSGIILTAIAVVVPLLLGMLGYAATELYALPKIDAGWAATYLPWTAFGVVLFLAALLISSKLWDCGKLLAVFVFCLSGAAGVALAYSAELIIGVMDQGAQSIEERDERIERQVNGE